MIKVFIVLLVISIIFVTHQFFYLEGFKEKDEVPSCGNSGVPGCYSTVKKEYNGFADVMESDYILKTQIVTPVCPNSPYVDWGDKKHKDKKEDKIFNHVDPLPIPNQAINQSMPNQAIQNHTIHNPVPFNLKNDISLNKIGSEPLPNSTNKNQAEFKAETPLLNGPIQDSVSIPKVNTPAEPSTKDDKKSQPSNLDTCPPCPACKRCPEPVVECKKIVNYKQAGSNRLPVPLVADFSKF